MAVQTDQHSPPGSPRLRSPGPGRLSAPLSSQARDALHIIGGPIDAALGSNLNKGPKHRFFGRNAGLTYEELAEGAPLRQLFPGFISGNGCESVTIAEN